MNLATTVKPLLAVLGGAVLLMAAARPGPQDAPSPFTSGTIDLGVMVGDMQKSIDFYTDLIGFTELRGFEVDAAFCTAAGLTDGHGAKVRVLALRPGEGSTSLKLISLPEAKPKFSDNAFIHSQLGYSYITIRTVSLAPVLARLKAAGVTPLAKGPVPLPGAGADGPHLAVVRDPDGNLVELIGIL